MSLLPLIKSVLVEDVVRPYTPVGLGLKHGPEEEAKEELGRWLHLLVKVGPQCTITATHVGLLEFYISYDFIAVNRLYMGFAFC